MRALPIAWKFAFWAAALAGIVLAIVAGGAYVHLYREQLEAADLELQAEASHLLAIEDDSISQRSIDELVRFQPWLTIAIFDADGKLHRRSGTLPEALARTALTLKDLRTVSDAKGETWRLTTLHRGSRTFVLAHALAEAKEIIRDLLRAYGLLSPAVLIVAAFGGWWVAGRSLAPLRALTTAAESIRADHLDRRVPVNAANDEIRRLADVLNAMLGRLEESFQQAQRFAADASHELRTPLTIMHGEIERLLRTPNLVLAQEETLLSLQEEISRLDRITEHLLLLARFDAGQATVARNRVDLSALARAACEDAELLADAREVELDTTIAVGLFVTGDDRHLRRVMLSLLDNATRYNLPGGKVHCVLRRSTEGVELRVRNTGPGIPEAARPHLFQRFFRVDPARARGGHGLGLSLSREIARAHGGKVELNPTTEPGWTEFVMTLPAAESSAPAVVAAG